MPRAAPPHALSQTPSQAPSQALSSALSGAPFSALCWPEGPPPLRAGRAHEAFGPAARAFAAALIGARAGPAVWIRGAAGPEALDPHGLAAFFDPARLIIAAARRPEDALWAMEECLRSGAAPTVIADYGGRLTLTAGRRLQLAAEAGGGVGLIMTPDAEGARPVSAAETRWRVSPARAPTAPPDALSPSCWRWELLKNKRGALGAWTIALTEAEADPAASPAALPSVRLLRGATAA